jgi:hypothetical protein
MSAAAGAAAAAGKKRKEGTKETTRYGDADDHHADADDDDDDGRSDATSALLPPSLPITQHVAIFFSAIASSLVCMSKGEPGSLPTFFFFGFFLLGFWFVSQQSLSLSLSLFCVAD